MSWTGPRLPPFGTTPCQSPGPRCTAASCPRRSGRDRPAGTRRCASLRRLRRVTSRSRRGNGDHERRQPPAAARQPSRPTRPRSPADWTTTFTGRASGAVPAMISFISSALVNQRDHVDGRFSKAVPAAVPANPPTAASRSQSAIIGQHRNETEDLRRMQDIAMSQQQPKFPRQRRRR